MVNYANLNDMKQMVYLLIFWQPMITFTAWLPYVFSDHLSSVLSTSTEI